MVRPTINNRGHALVIVAFFSALFLLICLGTWQVTRGLHKRALENSLPGRTDQYTEISTKPETWHALNHRKVMLKGRWAVDKTLLLDNRVHQHTVGYELYSPFYLERDDTLVLVNRGWLDAPRARETARSLTPDAPHAARIKGHLYLPQAGFTLGRSVAPQDHWPKVMQYFDVEQLSAVLHGAVAPAVLVLDEADERAYTRIWTPTVIRSTRHFGYAFQWWALALTLIIFGFIWHRQSSATR